MQAVQEMSSSKMHRNLEKSRILVVEDESEIRDLIALHLRRDGSEVDTAASVEEAKNKITEHHYSLFVLDWMLPGSSGIEFAKTLRAQTNADEFSVLMVTAKTEPADIVEGLEAGADDYLTKPFEPAVLIARVHALLRRQRRSNGSAIEKDGELQVLRAGDLAVYPETYEVKCNGEAMSLTPSEFKLLHALVLNRGRVLTRDSLIDQVQGEGVSVVGRTVDTHVFGLRKKMGECADIIETVRGVGYRVKPQSEL